MTKHWVQNQIYQTKNSFSLGCHSVPNNEKEFFCILSTASSYRNTGFTADGMSHLAFVHCLVRLVWK